MGKLIWISLLLLVCSVDSWTRKQLFPLTYRTRYEEDGVRHFCVWRMWLGRCFDIDDVVYHCH